MTAGHLLPGELHQHQHHEPTPANSGSASSLAVSRKDGDSHWNLFWLWASSLGCDYFNLILLQHSRCWDLRVAKRKSRDHLSQQDLSSGDNDAATIQFLITFCRFQCFVLHSLLCVYSPHLQPSSSKVWWRLLLPVKYLPGFRFSSLTFPFFSFLLLHISFG